MKSRFYIFVIIISLSTQFCLSQIPQTISYQGVLTDREGNPVRDGDYELTFILYDAAVEGKALWKEIQKLPITKGVMNAILGSAEKLALPFDQPYWLGISINQGDELSPRIPLSASAYSLAKDCIAW